MTFSSLYIPFSWHGFRLAPFFLHPFIFTFLFRPLSVKIVFLWDLFSWHLLCLEVVFHSHDFLLASLSLDIFVPCQQNPSCVLQTLHKSLSCTTKTCTKYFLVLLRITKLAQSTAQYYFVLQSLHKDLHSLPCKSRKNCADLPSNDKHGCSHSSATCEPGSPNTMAQHSQSSHEPASNQLYSGERVQDETREDRPCRKNQVPHIAAGKHFMQERQGFVRFLSFKHHLDEAFPLRAAIASLQITIELLQQEQQSERQK